MRVFEIPTQHPCGVSKNNNKLTYGLKNYKLATQVTQKMPRGVFASASVVILSPCGQGALNGKGYC